MTAPLRERLRALPVFAATLPPVDAESGLVGPSDPHEMFVAWLLHAVAAGEPEAHAMVVATLDADDPAAPPDARVQICKDVTEEGWWFAGSGDGPRGRQLAAHPVAALTFHWKAVGRQVRVRGRVEAAPADQAAADFRLRGEGARAVALASAQSEPVAGRERVRAAVGAARTALAQHPDAVPDDWRLWLLRAELVEFWQADPDRAHHRLRCSRTGQGWRCEQLWP